MAEGTNANATPIAPWKPARSNRKQMGSINISISKDLGGSRRNEVIDINDQNKFIQLNQKISAFWSLAGVIVDERDGEKDLCIGLFRIGTPNNNSAVFSKKLLKGKTSGRIDAYAPKMPGEYVFRIFDSLTKDSSVETFATSRDVVVVALNNDIFGPFERIVEALRDDKIGLALNMMQVTAEFMRVSSDFKIISLAKAFLHLNSELFKIIDNAIIESTDLLKNIAILEAEIKKIESERNVNEVALSLPGLTITDNTTPANAATEVEVDTEKSEKLKELFSKLHHTGRFHVEAYDVLKTICENPVTRELCRICPFQCPELPYIHTLSSMIEDYKLRYSPILQRFFSGMSELQAAHLSEVCPDNPFLPAAYTPSNLLSFRNIAQTKLLEKCIIKKCITMAQSAVEEQAKENFRGKIESILKNLMVISPATRVAAFGSSRNNLGSVDSDLDLCLLIPQQDIPKYGVLIDAFASLHGVEDVEVVVGDINKSKLIMNIGKALELSGFEVLQVRSTARIPIVHFKDPNSSFECDISYSNPLALRNTELFRLYTSLDVRVRVLGLFVKYWAKKRHINEPGEGTLSSYGFMLCVLHFLQRKSPPLIPNLQQLNRQKSELQWNVNRDGLDYGLYIASNQNSAMALSQPSNAFSVLHPIDNVYCDTYFFCPRDENELQRLREIGARNPLPIPVLLLEFFRYFAWEFDYRSNVITINSNIDVLGDSQSSSGACSNDYNKVFMSERYCWKSTDRISISDPFEPWYDVAHVVKPAKMAILRAEFLRAYTILSRALCTPAPGTVVTPDALSTAQRIGEVLSGGDPMLDGDDRAVALLIDILCEEVFK